MDGIDLIWYAKTKWQNVFATRYGGEWKIELEKKTADLDEGLSYNYDDAAVKIVEEAQKEDYNVGRKIKALYWWKELIKEIVEVKELVENNSENSSILKQSTEIRK